MAIQDLSKPGTGNDLSELTGNTTSVEGTSQGVPATDTGSTSHDHEGNGS
jgi:hypothetical protein